MVIPSPLCYVVSAVSWGSQDVVALRSQITDRGGANEIRMEHASTKIYAIHDKGKITFGGSEMKKSLSLLLLIGVMAILMCIPASALIEGDYSPGSSFAWSPNVTFNDVIVDSSTLVRVNTVFKFSETAAEINNVSLYFTIEHNARETSDQEKHAKMNAETYYSNLPGVHYDLDDDNADGYNEEAEAIATVKPLKANFDYIFCSTYSKPSTLKTGRVLTIAQRSALLGEYQALYADYLVDQSWSSARRSAHAEELSSVAKDITLDNISNQLIFYEDCFDMDSLDEMVNRKQMELEAYFDNTATPYTLRPTMIKAENSLSHLPVRSLWTSYVLSWTKAGQH